MSNFTIPPEETLRAREKLVLDHFHDKVEHAWDDVLATGPHPRLTATMPDEGLR